MPLRRDEQFQKNRSKQHAQRGARDSKAWQLQNRRTSSIAPEQVFHNATPQKAWYTSPGFGGSSKCWLGGTTRMMPGDFALKSRYGVGTDWPLSYDELEAHYCAVERIMLVSGPPDQGEFALPVKFSEIKRLNRILDLPA